MGAEKAYQDLSLANMINQEKNWALLTAWGDEASRFGYHSIQKSFVVGQQVVLSGPGGEGYKVLEYAETINIDSDEDPRYCILKEPRMDCASLGTLTVTVQRGNHYWLDERGKPQIEQCKTGPRGPLKKRPRSENSFRNLLGKNGRKIRWQFRVRSLDRMLEIEKSYRKKDGREPMSPEEKNDPSRYTLIRDEDFRLKQKQGHDYRMQLQKEYLEKRARENRPVRLRRVRKQPKICKCPKEHVGQICKKRKAVAEITGNGIEGASTDRTKRLKAFGAFPQHSEVNRTSAIPLEEPGTNSTIGEEALVAPRACKKCRRYKKAPKGKKWFFDRLSLVNGAEQNQTVRFALSEQPPLQQDEDNDEIVDVEAKPTREETWTAEAGEEFVPQVIGAEQGLVPTRYESQQPLLQQDEDDQEIINTHQGNEAQDTLHATETKARKRSSARDNVHGAPDQHQESDQPDSQVARIIIPTADFPAMSNPALSKPPSAAEKTPGKIWTPLRFTLHLYDGNSAAKANDGVDEERPGRIVRSPPQISGTSNREPLLIARLDLTWNSSSEIRASKKEPTKEVESKYQHIHVSSEDTEDEDEAELKNLQLRHEEIQLKIRMAKLKRKMKQKAAAKQQSRAKQEIIEID
ncbi:hypothetical protein CBER1_09093 [Cercospora berteroae]|uniref:Uncharacterized protein n=1 Tax=Cercospora berteroae TaxID=357750 RepID=A0A2S6C8Z0_9PEZI|nr:hypothetical protein CBER1_09093 [Cercospora berteroae]